jgi:hypothetical protein
VAQRTNGSLRILQYHGSGRYKYTAQQLAKDYDGECKELLYTAQQLATFHLFVLVCLLL